MAGAGGLVALEAAVAGQGLCLRGWVFPDGASAPRLISGGPAAGVVLIGPLGGGFWPAFEVWRKLHPGVDHPLDSWSKAVITPIAAACGGEAVFPSDRPWHPFQRWAMAAEGLQPSPLGLLIHPIHGLWHGYRGAILFGPEALAQLGLSAAANEAGSAVGATIHACDTCVDKPCLSACPVNAFGPNGFDVASCRAYLNTEPGRKGCMTSGCMARDACPVGRAYRYGDAQIRFHMTAYS